MGVVDFGYLSVMIRSVRHRVRGASQLVAANSEKERATKSLISVYAREFLFDFDKFGYGSAASTLVFLTIALMTIVYIGLGRVGVSGEAR